MNRSDYEPERIYTLSPSQESRNQESRNRNKHKWINDFIDRHAYRTRARVLWKEMEMIVALKGAKIDETVGDSLVGHAQVRQRLRSR